MHNDVTRLDVDPRGMLVLVIARENFDSGHFELFNLSRAMTTIRPAFLAGLMPCDVLCIRSIES
jgi:hypothetical protein